MAKPLFLGLLAVSTVVFTQAFRMPKRRVIKAAEASQVNISSANGNAIDAPSVLATVNAVDPAALLVSAMEGVAGFDWSGDIGTQTADLALSLFGSVLGTVNPLLGIAFTIFSGLFGLTRDADPTAELFKKIEKMIELQVRSAISAWYDDYKQGRLSAIMSFLKKEKTTDDWQYISNEIELDFQPIFNSSCWNAFHAHNDTACESYRKGFGGGPGLITEIEFVRMAVSVYLSLRDINHPTAPRIADELGHAAYLLYYHMNTWYTHRLRSDNFRRGSWQRSGPGYTTIQGQDAYLHKVNADRSDKDLDPPSGGQFSGPHCYKTAMNHRRRAYYPAESGWSYQHFGRRRAPQDHLNRELDACLNGWKNTVKSELVGLRRQVNGLVQSSLHIRNSNETRYLHQDPNGRSSCASGGYKPSRSTCLPTATTALRGLKPTRGMQVGCWLWVPEGCSVAAKGDWAVYFNLCNGSSSSNAYLNVCIKR